MKSFLCSLKSHTQCVMGAVLAAACLTASIPSSTVFAQEPSSTEEVRQEDTTNLFTRFFIQSTQYGIDLVEAQQNKMGIKQEQIPKAPQTVGPKLDDSLAWLSEIIGKPLRAWPTTPLWPELPEPEMDEEWWPESFSKNS